MDKAVKTKIRRFNIATHRDLGYFFSSLIIVYCLSGIALNHVNDWNPDFIIKKRTVYIDQNTRMVLTLFELGQLLEMMNESQLILQAYDIIEN